MGYSEADLTGYLQGYDQRRLGRVTAALQGEEWRNPLHPNALRASDMGVGTEFFWIRRESKSGPWTVAVGAAEHGGHTSITAVSTDEVRIFDLEELGIVQMQRGRDFGDAYCIDVDAFQTMVYTVHQPKRATPKPDSSGI